GTPRKPSHFGSYCHASPCGSSRTSSASIGGNGTFGPGTPGQPTGVGELDGLWDVQRTGGALPPLFGVRKRIHGRSGETLFGPVPVTFEVRGLELRYRPPLPGLVDVLERDGEGYRGRTRLFGREIGQFDLRRSSVSEDIEAQDRKSTRLNSSHSQIAYAVFCSKKKKTAPSTCSGGPFSAGPLWIFSPELSFSLAITLG